MSRPEVSVVMPFAGDGGAAAAAIETLLALDTRPGDELILADNSVLPVAASVATPPVKVLRAIAERSPAHARNAGAAAAHNDWILFLDADCLVHHGLLDAYFALPVSEDVGALAGEVLAAPAADTLTARYGAARGFLSQEAHLRHPYRPRAVAANLLVRRAAFEQVGGFYEGIRAGEDTDFSWRIQAAGWRLELRSEASVEHRYRTTLKDLRSQWRGYAAGRAWLARRYDGFEPEPALRRASTRAWRRLRRAPPAERPMARSRELVAARAGRLERGGYALLDALLSAEELAGFALSNRPRSTVTRTPAQVVLVADRFPARGDPLVEFAQSLGGARVEAAARPESLDAGVTRELTVAYREDDGIAARLVALGGLALTHPLRCALDRLRRGPGEPKLWAIAPAVRRLEHERDARVLALGGTETRATARRIAKLAGRPLDAVPRQHRRGGPLHPGRRG
ncbi:MAG TPA: glycosyltransferase family 2 protein [Solirubrobacteraceae bacterium]|nr:glycosyltransferase family 2 protein [Solirubrobacteraceae bacterium]